MKLFVAFVFLVCCAGVCGAIRCYECSYSDGNCADEFSSSGFTPADNCEVCSKVKGEMNGNQFVTRSCETESSSTGCTSGTYQEVDVDICICNTDLCNSAPSISARFAIVAISLVMFLKSL
ncbi:U-scoloptoxin(05)-Cw1a-like [Dreissena polymorpha]|uniref:Protein quiver n=1 Tax=Dreissena polymorpha TaxID=45954 RepID=A0A9D4J7A5_DREPO|nr:U-scoloptoxin(05)-Cw1a-like [Dreissena polymorpha]KAH3798754.1 hypothetical protein DPMN_152357 [Dreissena polymorpha]